MKKFRVTRDADYVMGHLRYGHQEGVIEAESLEDAKRKIEEDGYDDCLDLVIDDYSVDDADYGDNEFEYEEINQEEEI